MKDNENMTPGEANFLRKEAAEASVERDLAVYTALRASGREAVAREDAKEQHSEMLNAQAKEAHMNTLRRVTRVRADNEARAAGRARFGLYTVIGLVLAVSSVVVAMLITR